MSEWKIKRVKDLISYQKKGITPSYTHEGMNAIMILNQKCNRNFSISIKDARYHDLTKKKIPSELLLRKGDILINSTGKGTLGRIAQFSGSDKNITIDSHMLLIRPTQEIDATFFCYALKQLQPILTTMGIGSSGQEELDKASLNGIKISFPADVKEQRSIVEILRLLDKKIGINQKLNHNLEAMIQAIYDYWFVQFDFPDEKDKPYKSNGGKMVWNEELKRKIPAGWKSDNIGGIATIEGGGTPHTSEASYWDGNIPFYTPKDATDNYIASTKTIRNITKLGVKKSSTQLFTNAVFLTARGTVGRVQMPRIAMAMNQSCYALCPFCTIPTIYLFFVVKSIVDSLKVKANGAVFDAIVTRDILSIQLPLAELFIIQRFAEKIDPILSRIINIEKEQEILKAQRDLLLPLLMSGQVNVKPQDQLNYDLSGDSALS